MAVGLVIADGTSDPDVVVLEFFPALFRQIAIFQGGNNVVEL